MTYLTRDTWGLWYDIAMNQTDWWQKMFDQKYLDTYLGSLTTERTNQELDFLIKAVPLQPSDIILDLACGHGRHSIELARRGFGHITGLDYSETFITKANADADKVKANVIFMLGDMKELPFDNEFDVLLLLFTAFGYFDDETNKSVLKQINKALKHGGRFLMSNVSAEAVIERFSREGILDPENGLPKIHRQVEMTGHLTNEIEWFDKDEQIIHSHRDWQDKGQKKEYDYWLHVYSLPQYQQMLSEVGFTVEKTWGDFDGQPFKSEGTHSTLILAKKNSF